MKFPKPVKNKISAKEWKAMNKKTHKYKAEKTIIDGIAFPSKLEGSVYRVLLLRAISGEIKNIKQQVNVRVREACEHCGEPPLDFTVDFSFENCRTDKTDYAEAKGFRDSSYIKRERAWKKNPPGVLEVWGGTYKQPKLLKVISPKVKP